MSKDFEDELIKQVCKTKIPFKKLNGKKILVTGCYGFIPSAFIKIVGRVMEINGYKIHFYGIARKNGKNRKNILRSLIKQKVVKILNLDLNKEFKLNKRIDYCLHGASTTAPKKYLSNPTDVILPNSMGLINLLKSIENKRLKKFIFLSSSEVYGNFSTLNKRKKSFFENEYGSIDCTNINSSLALSKKFGENYLYSWGKEQSINTNSVRLFHSYGPFMKLGDGRIHSDLVKNVIMKRNLLINGNPKVRRAFCYISDVISGILTIMFFGKNGQSYNLANPKETYSVKKIAKIIQENQKKNYNVKIIFNKNKKIKRNDFFYPKPSIEKLKKIGWKPRVSVKEGLMSTINYFKKNKI